MTTNTNTASGAADSPKLQLLLDSFPEQNPRNFDPDAAIQLNEWGIAIVEELYRLRALAASAPVAPTQPESLHTFLNAAAAEGYVLNGVDAADLYVELFPECYVAALEWFHSGMHGASAEAAPVAPAHQPAASFTEGGVFRSLIEFLLHADDALAFLRCWNEGDFGTCRKEWPEAPPTLYPDVAPNAALQQGEYLPTGNPEADRVLGWLNSSDPDFDDCAEAAALIYKLVSEIKGPDGFATWKDAAVYERGLRATLETTINTASPLAYLYTDGKHPGLDFKHAPAEDIRPGFVCIPLVAAHLAARGAAQAAQAAPAPAVQPVGAEFFAYDTDAGFETYGTADEARQAALDAIKMHREETHSTGEWADEVESVCWGVVVEKSASFEDGSESPDGERGIDFTLSPLSVAPPAPVAEDAEIRKALSDAQKREMVAGYFAEDWAIENALHLLDDFERHGITAAQKEIP